MCLDAIKVFEKPVKTMTGWKYLENAEYHDGYQTPYQGSLISTRHKWLKASGKREIRTEYRTDPLSHRPVATQAYHGGFIHCYRTRAAARNEWSGCNGRIIKVKCYNVHAIGRNDLVCDKIEFLWEKKT